MCMFNALFIIDCWDDAWIRSFGARHMRKFYGQMIDYLDQYEYGHVYLCTDSNHSVHPWIRSHWDKKRTTIALSHRDVNPRRLSQTANTSMCAGTSWTHCVHNNNLGILQQMKFGFRVHSAPELVRANARTNHWEISYRDFVQDTQIEWQPQGNQGLWRAARIKSFTKS